MLRRFLNWLWSDKQGRVHVDDPHLADQKCLTCCHFDHCDPEDVDGTDGYCCHPNHSDWRKSPHYEYGGHWTNSQDWCSWWESKAVE